MIHTHTQQKEKKNVRLRISLFLIPLFFDLISRIFFVMDALRDFLHFFFFFCYYYFVVV